MPDRASAPEDVSAFGKIEPTDPKGGLAGKGIPQPDMFNAFLNGTQAPAETEATGISPMELAQKNPPMEKPTVKSLLEQMNTSEETLQTISSQLHTPQLKFKRSSEHLLNNKLRSAQKSVSAAGERMGAAMPEAKDMTGPTPFERFISFAAHGQDQYAAVKNQLGKMASQPGMMNPADMLLIQVKLAQAQQELEYASALISKSVAAIKETLNIQI